MSDRTKILLPLLFAALLITGMFIGARIIPVNALFNGPKTSGSYNNNKIQDILYLIEQDYVDEVDRKELVDLAIQGLLQQLDPHSVYITAEELNAVNEEIAGHFEGIGVQFSIRRDTVMVIKVLTGGPAEKAGMLAGDRIVAVGNKMIAGNGITNDEVMKLLKGPRGSEIVVEVMRKGRKDQLLFVLTRDVIQTHSIDAAFMARGNTGYLKLHTFAGNTYNEFMEELNKLMASGMKNLILDLRGNSGGLLDQAIYIANEFLGNQELIVYTQGKSGRKKMSYANGNGIFRQGGLVVLIDDFSASASEIIAGAIQDNDRGLIVGRRSFGKGLVQQQIMLADGSALRLTTERYYTPAGRSIQKPYSSSQEEYYGELMTRYQNGGMDSPDSIPLADSLKFLTLKKKRTVYGGGGIMPDYFIPLNRKHETVLYRKLSDSGVIFEFAADYADKNRQKIVGAYSSVRFVSSFELDESAMAAFWKYAAEKEIKRETELQQETGKQLRFIIKAFIARDLYGDDAFYKILNSRDEAVLKALSVLGE